MRTVLLLLFLALSHTGFAQLIDPFEKIKTHEIKLTKLDDGAYMGAMEWTTGGIDSLQRFVVQNLDVKAPVMVRIISKAPDHNIDLSFHKKKWDKAESIVSTNGDKFVDKIFRTMGTAGIGVSSKVAGIPYLITVKVGLQFPSTKSLIRITDDLEEYNRHLKKMGIATFVPDKNVASSNNANNSVNTSDDSSNTLMYVIIGLLSSIIVLLGLFLIRKQKSKSVLVLWFAICFSCYSLAQTNVPKPVPIGNPNGAPVFVEYRTTNVANQNTVPVTTIMNSQDVDVISDNTDETGSTRSVRINTSPGTRELTPAEAEEVHRRMREADEEFDREYRENMPGEETEGDQRIPPTNETQQELEELRRQVRRLQRQVDLLSQDDSEYEEEENDEAEILIYCEQIEDCETCMNIGFAKFAKHYVYYQYLQDYFLNSITDLNAQIASATATASVPGAGLGYGPILRNRVMPAINNLRAVYRGKFKEYIRAMEDDLESIRDCHTGENGAFPSMGGYESQLRALINDLKATVINL